MVNAVTVKFFGDDYFEAHKFVKVFENICFSNN